MGLWDRAVNQVGCALVWAGANIPSQGGDPNRLALIGNSAGGNLVINAGYMADAGKLTSTCGGRIPGVRAVSALYPGVDLTAINENTYIPIGRAVQDMTDKYVGGPARRFPERYGAVASKTQINPAAPPTLVFITEHDHLVPLDSVRAFVRDARSVSIPNAEHGFDVVGIGNALMRQVTLQFIDEHARRLS